MKIKSSQPRKQRKNRAKAPLHAKHRMVSCHLDRALIREYNVRSAVVRKGDTVKILRGEEGVRGTEAKVSNVYLRKLKIVVENITMPKADGTQKAILIDPSNCVITKLDFSDPIRKNKLTKLKEGSR